jgi:hypothetical protein
MQGERRTLWRDAARMGPLTRATQRADPLSQCAHAQVARAARGPQRSFAFEAHY